MKRASWGRIVLVAVFAVSGAQWASAALINVNGSGDENSSSPPNLVCTLREAVISSNSDVAVGGCAAGSGADSIVLPAGTFTLSIPGAGEDLSETGDLDLLKDVFVLGAGSGATIVDGGALDVVFHVLGKPASSFGISDLTVQNGNKEGILGASGLSLNVSNVLVRSNAGTGIATWMPTWVLGSTVRLNNDMGIYSFTDLTLSSSLVENNTGSAGGVYNYGVANISQSTIRNNTTAGLGGGFLNAGIATVTDTTIDANTATGGGAGIQSTCFPHCGALLTIERSTISNNVGDGLASLGAFGTSQTTVINSTISGNTGRGVWNGSSVIDFHHVTLVNNGGIELDMAPGLGTTGATFANSLIVGTCVSTGVGLPVSSGGNLESPGNTCGLTGTGDAVNAPTAFIGPLANNGGPTKTHALIIGSPAIGTGLAGNCEPTDQRGTIRPQGANCDKGAYELSGCGASLAVFLPPTLLLLRRGKRRSLRAMLGTVVR